MSRARSTSGGILTSGFKRAKIRPPGSARMASLEVERRRRRRSISPSSLLPPAGCSAPRCRPLGRRSRPDPAPAAAESRSHSRGRRRRRPPATGGNADSDGGSDMSTSSGSPLPPAISSRVHLVVPPHPGLFRRRPPPCRPAGITFSLSLGPRISLSVHHPSHHPSHIRVTTRVLMHIIITIKQVTPGPAEP